MSNFSPRSQPHKGRGVSVVESFQSHECACIPVVMAENCLSQAFGRKPKNLTRVSFGPCNLEHVGIKLLDPTSDMCEPINEEENKNMLGDVQMSLSSLVFIGFQGCPISR